MSVDLRCKYSLGILPFSASTQKQSLILTFFRQWLFYTVVVALFYGRNKGTNSVIVFGEVQKLNKYIISVVLSGKRDKK